MIEDKIDKYIGETVNENSQDLIAVVDSFTRYLMGDARIAANQLMTLSSRKLDLVINTDSKEYNKQFSDVREKLIKAIRSSLL